MVGHSIGLFLPGAQLVYIPARLLVRTLHNDRELRAQRLSIRIEAKYGYLYTDAETVARYLLFDNDGYLENDDWQRIRTVMHDINSGEFDPLV